MQEEVDGRGATGGSGRPGKGDRADKRRRAAEARRRSREIRERGALGRREAAGGRGLLEEPGEIEDLKLFVEPGEPEPRPEPEPIEEAAEVEEPAPPEEIEELVLFEEPPEEVEPPEEEPEPAGGIEEPEERAGPAKRVRPPWSPRGFWLRIPSRTRLGIIVFFICLISYTLVLALVPRYKGTPITDGDEPHYLIITQSLLEDGDVSVADNYRERQYKDYYKLKIEVPHTTKGSGGRRVSTHPLFLSLVVLPGFWIAGWWGAAFTMVIMTSFAALLTFLLADRFASRPVAAGVTLLLFLSYPLLFYSRLIYPETAAMFLLALGVWSTWRLRESRDPTFAAVAGLSAGLLMLFHPKFFPLSLSLLLLFFLAIRRRSGLLLWWFVPAAACFGVLLIITGTVYGPDLLKGLTASGGGKLVGGYWGTNSVWGVFGIFLDRAWGLFIFAPLYLLFPIGMSLQHNRMDWTRWWAFFPACIVAHALMLGIFQSWNGGAAPVQRYVVPLAALLVVCVAVFLDRCRNWISWVVAAFFCFVQVTMTVWAFRFMVGTYGMAGKDNIFLRHFLGKHSALKGFLLGLFPLYHPAGTGSIMMTIYWVAVFALFIWIARWWYRHHGGGKLSPVIDIQPFKHSLGSGTRLTPTCVETNPGS